MLRALVTTIALALLVPAAHSTSTRHDDTPGAMVSQSLAALAGIAGVDAVALPQLACGALSDALADFAATLGVPAPASLPAIAASDADAIAQLVCALHAATLARNAAYADVDPVALARAVASGSERPDVELDITHVAANAAGARHIAIAVDDALKILSPRAAPHAPALALPQYNFPPVLAMDLVGVNTLYADDVALVVDVGGNDVYDNNAGGSLLAFGDGNFIRIEGDPSTFGQSQCVTFDCSSRIVVGGDFEDAELVFSAALVLDLTGDDTYGVLRTPYHDARCTSDPLVRKVAIQGTGAGGPGLLFDLAGNNHFIAKTIAQGSGHVGGVGVMYLGDGDDTLEAARLAQGSGLFFGLGLLINHGGNDVYKSRMPSGGVFNTDGGFCDAQPRYLHGSGFARVTGGASGVAGALIDLAGDDTYIGDTKGAGFAEVASVGLLLDVAGDDTYWANDHSLGFASGHPSTSGGGLALFFDVGGNDRYTLTSTMGLGATPGAIADPADFPLPFAPYTFWVNELVTIFIDPVLVSGAAMFYDGGGDDVYDSPAARANGEARPTTVGGVFVDR